MLGKVFEWLGKNLRSVIDIVKLGPKALLVLAEAFELIIVILARLSLPTDKVVKIHDGIKKLEEPIKKVLDFLSGLAEKLG